MNFEVFCSFVFVCSISVSVFLENENVIGSRLLLFEYGNENLVRRC